MKNRKPKVSVIMSVYNGEKYLREAIESILNQTFTDFEFIIVNDGSTDSSLEIIKSYDDERIKIIDNKKNIGLTKSLNKALKQACGEYIARQDADDVSLPNRFEEQIKYFEEHPEIAVLGTNVYKINKEGEVIGKGIVLANPGNEILKTNQFRHGSVMFKKGVTDKLGGYNELFKLSQDYELWLRIAKHYGVRNLTQMLYKLRFHDENIWSSKIEKGALYHLLAIRLTRNNLEEEALEAIKDKGISSLYSYLSKNEKLYFHKVTAYTYLYNNNLKLAREGYKKVFNLNPFDIENNINIILSYLGKSVIIRSYKLYRFIKNFLVYLKNCYSK